MKILYSESNLDGYELKLRKLGRIVHNFSVPAIRSYVIPYTICRLTFWILANIILKYTLIHH